MRYNRRRALERCILFLAVLGVLVYFEPWPHELGHKIMASDVFGYEAWIEFDGLRPCSVVVALSIRTVPMSHAVLITFAGGLAASLSIIFPFLAIKHSVVKEAFKVMLVMFFVRGIAEGMYGAMGLTDYAQMYFVMGSFALVVLERFRVFHIREVFGFYNNTTNLGYANSKWAENKGEDTH